MAIEVPLTDGYVMLVDEEDADFLKRKCSANVYQGMVYAVCCGPIHREILERKIGRKLVRWELCDHDNRNSLDNTRSNLRIATYAQNNANRSLSKVAKSGYRGVREIGFGKWAVDFYANSKRVYLKPFDTKEDAARAFNEAALLHLGEFAVLNVIKEENE
jgi:hypothetical protein